MGHYRRSPDILFSRVLVLQYTVFLLFFELKTSHQVSAVIIQGIRNSAFLYTQGCAFFPNFELCMKFIRQSEIMLEQQYFSALCRQLLWTGPGGNDSGRAYCCAVSPLGMYVLHIVPVLTMPIGIQHTQCPRQVFILQ